MAAMSLPVTKVNTMRIEMMTSPAVANYLAHRSGIIVPVGATEQHGPDGLIGTDHLCVEAIARQCADAEGIIVAPTVAYGMSQFHLAFSGTISLRPSTLSALILDIVQSLAVTGFRRIYFLNGHGGNLPPMHAAIQEFYTTRSMSGDRSPAETHCRVVSWWALPNVDRLRRELYGAQEGYHATPSEVALTQAVFPDVIRTFSRPAPPPAQRHALQHGGDHYFDAADFRARFADGRVLSHSALARPEHGKALLAAAAIDLAADFSAFENAT